MLNHQPLSGYEIYHNKTRTSGAYEISSNYEANKHKYILSKTVFCE